MPTKKEGNDVQLMHENNDIASECGIVRVDDAWSKVKGGRTGEVPSKTRERGTEKAKDTEYN